MSTINLTLNEKYHATLPKKGTILKGPVYTAYKRESLGTIPRKSENIIIEDKTDKSICGFSSQSERFSTRSHSIDNPGPGTYQVCKDFNYTSSKSFYSSKGFGNGFISTSDRFDGVREFYDQFYPGPGQYKSSTKASLMNDINKNLLYKGLFRKDETVSLKDNIETPGPGYYNIKNKHNQINDPSYIFKSSTDRFKTEKNFSTGPGIYFKEEEQDKLKTESYYFKNPLEKKEDLLNKHLNIKEPYVRPGPGSYNLRSNIGKDFNTFTKYQEIKNNIWRTSKVERNIKTKSKDNKLINTKEDLVKKESKTSYYFVSKSPKFLDSRNHIPGPAYYSPTKSPKKSHNFNIDNIWI